MTSRYDDPVVPSPLQPSSALRHEDPAPVAQTELDDILNDPTLLPNERRDRLEALAASHGASADVDRGDDRSFLSVQIADALALLAQGGHTYDDRQTDDHLEPNSDK